MCGKTGNATCNTTTFEKNAYIIEAVSGPWTRQLERVWWVEERTDR